MAIAQSLHGALTPVTDRPDEDRTDEAPRIAGRIAYQDSDLIVIAKQRGELVHGPNSLEDDVRAYLHGRLAGGLSFRPGPVHRLDRNTSGLVVFAVSLRGAQAAAAAFRDGTIVKRYVAVFEGTVKAAVWRDSLSRDERTRTTRKATGEAGSRDAVTIVEPVAANGRLTVATVRIATGRTHQIRSQAALHGHPLAGDRKYGSTAPGPYLLHAASLTATGGAVRFGHLHAQLPEPFAERLRREFGARTVREIERRSVAPAAAHYGAH